MVIPLMHLQLIYSFAKLRWTAVSGVERRGHFVERMKDKKRRVRCERERERERKEGKERKGRKGKKDIDTFSFIS